MWLDKFIFTPGAEAPGGPFAQRPAPGNAGNIYYADEGGVWRDDGAQWRPLINGYQGYQPPLASAFTPFNQGTSTLNDSNGALLLVGAAGDGAQVTRGFTVSSDARTTDYVIAAFAGGTDLHVGAAYPEFGLVMREASSGKMMQAGVQVQSNGDGGRELQLVFAYATDNTTRSTSTAGVVPLDGNAPMWLRLRRNPLASNYLAEYSRDASTWVIVASNAGTFSSAIDQVGLYTSSFSAVARALVLSFRSGH